MRQTLARWLSLLTVLFVLSVHGPVTQAALLDVGPVVPQVVDSTEPNLGHGFPRWYRDTNRLPLELCLVKDMCLTAEPNPLAPFSFPGNFGAEVFWWAADATIDYPGGSAILVQAIEGAFPTEDATPGGQLSFARIRIRVDTPQTGRYTITTPFKQFTFDVTDVAGGINHTEDVGIAEGGNFNGALAGSVGPFLYCSTAPIVTPAGSFVGDPNVPCTVLGSTFPDPRNSGQMTNLFRVEGPGIGRVETNLFNVMGKIFTDPIPTPLTVDRLTYSREATGVQLNAFATTQALSNQTVPTATFPGNFALTGAPSALQVTASGVPEFAMATNVPADGKFFGSSGVFPDPTFLPTTATVTNTSDIPVTARQVPLVDEVVVEAAMYNPLNKRLTVSASSYDRIGVPALSAFMPGSDLPLGTLVNGQLSVTFPITDNTVTPAKTFNIPPAEVVVRSALGGSDKKSVASLAPGATNSAPVAVDDAADVAAGESVIIDVAGNDSDPDLGDLVVGASVVVTQGEHGTATAQGNGTVLYAAAPGFVGTDAFTYTIRDGFGAISNIANVTVKILDATANLAPVAIDDAAATAEDTPAIINVAANDGDPDGNLAATTVTVTSQPANGVATVNASGNVAYTPSPNFNGSTTFRYTVRDSLGLVSNEATVTVTVNPVNDAPIAANDSATTTEDSPVTFSVSANDSDLEGNLQASSVQIVIPPANGTAVANPDGTVTYTPAANFFGSNSFSYTISDGASISNQATATITVTSVNDAPVANGDVATAPSGTLIAINVAGNDTDLDGTINVGSVAIASQPANGTVTVNPNGTVNYTSNSGFSGTDNFSYTVRDNNGALSAAATVTVSVTAANSENVTILRAQYRASTGEWRIDGAITNAVSNSVTVYVGRNLTGQVLGSTPVTAGTWSLRLPAGNNPVPDASNTVSAQGLPGGGSRLAFPVALR